MGAKAVIFTVFDRELLLQRTLESWSRVRGKSDFDFYFKIEETSKLPVISKMIDNFEKSIQQPVTIIINSGILGCALNTWQALDLMFQKYDFVILAEDDFIVSVDVLDYFKNLEEMYRDDRGVGVISANFEAPGFRDNEISRLETFRGQVWGTWRNHWNSYFKNTWDFDYSSGKNGGPSGWDWNLSLRILPKNGLVTIVPHSSRSMHTGLHGVHSNRKNFAESQTISFQSERANIELIEVDLPEWNFRDKVIRRTAQKLSRPGSNYRINAVARRLLQDRSAAHF